MPMSITTTAGGTSYGDIRVGEGHGIHQGLLDAAGLAASRDADGNLPVGLPVLATGLTVTIGTAYGFVGPEPVKLGATNTFGNLIMTGVLNRDMIEANLGRVLTAAELAGVPSTIKLI